MRGFLIGAAACALLAAGGCQKVGEDESAAKAAGATGETPDEEAAPGAIARREPGLWKTTVELKEMSMPGMPDSVRRQMGEMMASSGSSEMCLTAQQAAEEDIAKRIAEANKNADCTFDRKTMGNGRIDVAGSCKADGRNVAMTMTGDMTPTRMDVVMTSEGEGPTGPMKMAMRIVNTRTGDCPG